VRKPQAAGATREKRNSLYMAMLVAENAPKKDAFSLREKRRRAF
jgi:hypothetical protein